MKRTRRKTRTAAGNSSQEWATYNLFATTEKEDFPWLAWELAQHAVEPIALYGPGRPGISYPERVLCLLLKAFCRESARRLTPDLKIAHVRGHLSRTPHFNSVLNFLRDEALTDVLEYLLIVSSWPLRPYESYFAIDSTSFSTDEFKQWRNVKYGKDEAWHDWRKLHIIIGVDTHIITAALTSRAYANDYTFLRPLVRTTLESGFKILELYADKAYFGADHLKFLIENSIRPYIPFKKNANPDGKSKLWKLLWDEQQDESEEFSQHYHLRSNVETVFSMIKELLSHRLRTRTERAQGNEMLVKAICHNLRMVLRAKYELGIEPNFAEEPPVRQEPNGQLAFPLSRINYRPGINRVPRKPDKGQLHVSPMSDSQK
jgi:transposase